MIFWKINFFIMQTEPEIKSISKSEFLFQNHRLRLFILIVLFISAFCIRVYHITRPPLDFAPIRQYQNAHIARGYYYAALESVSEEKKEIARLNMQRMGFLLEPRIIEHLAVFGYRIAGAEYLWIPRILSSIFWVIGGIFLYLIAIKITSSGAALFSTVFYLFLPYGIIASRSFQPDPLMVMMLLCSIFMILKYYEQPSLLKLIISAIVSSFAILIKPYSLFFLFGAFISIAVYKRSWKSLISKKVIAYTFLSFLLPFIYYGFVLFNNIGSLKQHAEGSFLPHLLLKTYFWKDWLTMIGSVVGYLAFIIAFLGLFLIHRGLSKTLLVGLWIGYFFFGLSATYLIHTHDYYQLQFIPVIALSIGPVGALVMNRLSLLFSSRKRITIFSAIFIVLIFVIGLSIQQIQWKDYKNQIKILGAVVGINPQFYKFLTDNFEKEVRIAKEIGKIVGHSTNTVFLTPYFGRELAYHGELSGLPWPISISLQERKERGLKVPQKEELSMHSLTIRTHGKYIKYTPDYFIITDFKEFEKQVDLKEFLYTNFPLMAENDDYLIFDLRKMAILQ